MGILMSEHANARDPISILVLQDSIYYRELGVDFTGCAVTYGLPITSSVRKILRKFDLVISCLDHDDQAHKVICLANSESIPTAYISDGIYDVMNAEENNMIKLAGRKQLFPAAYGTVFCVGEKFVSWYKNFYPEVSVYDYLPLRASINFDGVEITEKKTVLITTALRPYFNEEDYFSVVNELRRVIDWLKNINVDYRFRIFDSRILKDIPEMNVCNNVSEPISLALTNASCVISTTSTILHTCSKYGIPSLLLNHRNTQVLYEVDYIVDKGEPMHEDKLYTIMTRKRKVDSPVVGVEMCGYDFSSPVGLLTSTTDFSNSGFKYFSRRMYRKLPKSMRNALKKLVV